MKTLELHYPMIQFLIISALSDICVIYWEVLIAPWPIWEGQSCITYETKFLPTYILTSFALSKVQSMVACRVLFRVIAWRVTSQRRLTPAYALVEGGLRGYLCDSADSPAHLLPNLLYLTNIWKFQNERNNAGWSFACCISLLWQHPHIENLGHVTFDNKTTSREQGEAWNKLHIRVNFCLKRWTS